MDENEYKKELAANGVEIPEVKEEATPDPKVETEDKPKEDPKDEPKPKVETDVKPDAKGEHLQTTPKEDRKRSIYEEYKDKKSELKTEKELREKAERERDELQQKLENFNRAGNSSDRQDAKDEIDAFLETHKEWDKGAINDLLNIARKGIKPELDESFKRDIEEFRTWKSQNAMVVEKQLFDEEFKAVAPSLKEYFPNASSEDMEAIKKELDVISHKEGWHDKSLDYVVFKNKDKLSSLVSPKKRGMESNDRKDIETESFDFDPNADYMKLTPAQREKWEIEYNKMMKNDGLVQDARGRKIII